MPTLITDTPTIKGANHGVELESFPQFFLYCFYEFQGAGEIGRAFSRTSGFIPKPSCGERGFRLGFCLPLRSAAGSGLYQLASILYHLTTARRLRSGDTQRFREFQYEM